jgi:hypothetical protein
MDRNRPTASEALVVALIALVFAAAGTAIAEPSAFERALTKSKVRTIARKQANKAVAARAPVFAQVDQNGVVNGANSSGIEQADVISGSVGGYYCFSGLPFTPRGGSVTLDWYTSGDMITTMGLGGNDQCPAGTQAFVNTRLPDGSGSRPSGFFVTFYR